MATERPVPAEPALATSLPTELALMRPTHLRVGVSTAWKHRSNLGFVTSILTRGVCDACALGPRGLADDVLPGPHLCLRRLRKLSIHTLPALAPVALTDVSRLRAMTGEELRQLGRLPYPFLRRSGQRGFARISWTEAFELAAKALREAPPERIGWLVGTRGLTNEAAFAVRRAATAIGGEGPHLHSPRVVSGGARALLQSLGDAAPPGGLADLASADLALIWGADLPYKAPVAMKYLTQAQARGARVVYISTKPPPRGPIDDFVLVRPGSDAALAALLMKRLREVGAVDERFVEERTTGIEALWARLDATPTDALLERVGIGFGEVGWLAELIRRAPRLATVWSTGLTRRTDGVQTLRAVLDLQLLRGAIGRPGCGVFPLEGPVGLWSALSAGLSPDGAAEQLLRRAAHTGLDALALVATCLWDDSDERGFVQRAIPRIGLRIHQTRFLDRGCLLEPGEATLLLPARSMHEQRGGSTLTSIERRVRFSPELADHPWIGEARSDWEILGRLAARTRPDAPAPFESAAELRAEMDLSGGRLRGTADLSQPGDFYQWGGMQLHRERFDGFEDGRARLAAIDPLVRP